MSLSLSLIMATVLASPAGESPPDFETQIMPVLTKAGCNAGACHGAAAGRGEFHLSLWGGNPEADYLALVREFAGRRVNLARPEESLILRKPTGETGHGGGLRFAADSPSAKRLRDWIAAGAKRGPPRRLREFLVTPETQIVAAGQTIPLRARAAFDQGNLEDVSAWTVWTPTDPSAIQIDLQEPNNPATAQATVLRPGQHVIIARFLNRVVPLQLLLPFGNQPLDLSGEPRANFVDELVLEKLEDLRLPPSPLADEQSFLRRVTLDLTGRLPSHETMQSVMKESRNAAPHLKQQREARIDQLLESEEFIEYWTFQLAQLFRVGGQRGQLAQAKVFHGWLEEQLRQRTPFDRLARELITASGDPLANGPANFYLAANDARAQAEYVSQTLLGVRLRCANCHDHPLDRWTQDDYHGFAAVFARMDRGPIIREKSAGEVIHPKTGEPATPRIPGTRDLAADENNRLAVADWLTTPENPYLARAVVNRLWQAMMGRGLVDPTDDLSQTNPATHPELLDRLAADFVAHHYDVRHVLRLIAMSRTYQRGSRVLESNQRDDRFYSHQQPRKLPAEVLLDAWCDVTNVPESYPQAPEGTRAVELTSPHLESRALDVLGRCLREGDCEAGTTASSSTSLAAKLHLLNGEVINRKIADPKGRLRRLVKQGLTDDQIVQAFYERALSRVPRAEEVNYWKEQFQPAASDVDRLGALEDFLWSLLTCREFTSNH